MATTSQAKATKETLVKPESFVPYFEKLTERHEQISKALQDSQLRSQRIGTEFVNALIAGQRTLLELTQQFATKPQDLAGNVKAMVDAVTVAQERSLSVAKVLYREQADAGSEVRKIFQSACDSSDTLGEAGRNLLNFWTKQR
ncbi:MAG: hypothetical protein EXR86_06300 [Gammaproteobacteria bacterium]|nr:hypothetical protein [Gammaproteobacteria bacterium]